MAEAVKKEVPRESPERPAIAWMVKESLDRLCLEDKVRNNKEGSSDESLENKCKEACKKRISQNAVSALAYKDSFKDPAARLAHVYMHFTKNAYLVNSVLCDAFAACTDIRTSTTVFNEMMGSVDRGKLNIFSLGSGPGDDVLGVLMYLHRHGWNRTKITAGVADLSGEWQKTSKDLFKALQVGGEGKDKKDLNQHDQYLAGLNNKLDGAIKYYSTDIKAANYLSEPNTEHAQALKKADIILLPFVLSAFKKVDECATGLQTVLESMKPGALLVYIDQPNVVLTEHMNEQAYCCGLRRVYFMTEMTYELPKYEKKEYMSHYATEFDTESMRTNKVTSLVFKRPANMLNNSSEFGRVHDNHRLTERERKNVEQAQSRLRSKNKTFRFFDPSQSGY